MEKKANGEQGVIPSDDKTNISLLKLDGKLMH